MEYEGIVYRPPSEAYSLIIQVTIGCSHNKCSFCSMYKDKKFRIRSLEEVYKDLHEARKLYSNVERIFLADGDSLVLKTEMLEKILLKIKKLYPECKRVSAYAAPKDILKKSENELENLKKLGLKILYMGIESGDDEILQKICKGVTCSEIIEAGKKVKNVGIKLSVTLISGIGGKYKWKKNALGSAKIITSIDPDYVGVLTLLVEPGTKMYEEVNSGDFKLLNPKEIMLETLEFIKNINVTNCIFRSNHPSNYVALRGTFPQDKEKMIDLIEDVINGKYEYRPERFRAL
ncbi:radical SAM protein [Clostridium sp. JS66]|uniref:radical SAM protein n=1 Tax=Clostridium sp. JS66 TaxID=3064705 RepID=UPI00298E2E6F|nr:radical SAM protein [Clostridium sp. JS66]WPC39301.1 radical SAM protein [Clostridium sp. JS66]